MPVPGPHKVHVASVDKYRPTGQPFSDATQRPSFVVKLDALQSEALTGHMVVGSSTLLLMQQHRRVLLEAEVVQEEVQDDD